MANLGRMIASMGVDLTRFKAGMARAEARMRATGKKMRKWGKQMTTYVSLPLALIGGKAISTFAKFQAAMNQVSAVSGETGRKLQEMTEQARHLGSTTKFSAIEAAQGMNFLSMAGFEANETMKAMPATLNLAAAGAMKLGDSADIVSNIMQGFGIQAERTTEVTDVLTKTFTSSNTNLKQLGDAMSYVAPVARGFGQSIQMTSAAVGMLSDAGIQGSRAGTGLRRVLSIMAKKADELGVQVFDANGSMRDLASILADIEKKGMSSAEVMEIFGMRGGPVMQTLLSRGSKALTEFTQKLHLAGGTAERVAETQMKGIQGAAIELKSAMNEMFIAFVEPFAEWIENLVDGVKGFTQWMGELSESTRRTIGTLTALTAAAGPLLIVLGFMMSNVIPGLMVAFRSLWAVMAANPITAILSALALLGTAIAKHIRYNRTAADSIQDLNDIRRDAEKAIAQERTQLENLFAIAQDENASLEARRAAINKLNKVSPEYFDNLSIENINTQKAIDLKKQYIDQLLKEAKVKAAQDKLVELEKERIDALEEARDLTFGQRLAGYFRSQINPMKAANKGLEDQQENIKGVNEEYDKATKTIRAFMREMMGTDAFKTWLTQSEIMKEMNAEIEEAQQMSAALGGEFDIARRKSQIYKDAITKLIENGHDPEAKVVTELRGKIERLSKEIKTQTGVLSENDEAVQESTDAYEQYGKFLETMSVKLEQASRRQKQAAREAAQGVDFFMNNQQQEQDVEMPDALKKFNEEQEKTKQTMQGLYNMAHSVFNGMQNVIMESFNGSQSILQGFGRFFANFIKGLIAKLVAATISAAILSVVLNMITGGGANLSAAAKSAMSFKGLLMGMMGFGGGGLQGLAEGGKVTRPGAFIVGEGGEPEVVQLRAGDAVTPIGDAMPKEELVSILTYDQIRILLRRGGKIDKRRR